MTVEKLEIKSNPGATLTAYLLDTSKEMPNMTDRPAVWLFPAADTICAPTARLSR